jgi:hypothetical protein
MQFSCQVQQVVDNLKNLSFELGSDNVEQLVSQFNEELVILSQLMVNPDASLYEKTFREIAIIVNDIKESLVEMQYSLKEEFESSINSMKNEAKYLRQA